jgi:serine/threonine protein kinase
MTESDSYIGNVLDEKYRLERLLGRGGMGAVYLASHMGTERYVALKLITPQFMRNEEFVARFKREARAAGRLRHPNVVDVTDFGFADVGTETVAYLVMEYLDGCTLGDVLAEERRLPLEWVVDILEQVCSAVHEAHQQGIVHRDLKPENIWLEPNRLGGYRVKVLDFGIAKLAEVEMDGALPTTAASSTQLKDPAANTSPGGAETSIRMANPTAVQDRETEGQVLEVATLMYSAAPQEQLATEHGAAASITRAYRIEEEQSTQLFETDPGADPTLTEEPQSSAEAAGGDDDRTLMFGKSTQQAPAKQQTKFRTDETGRGVELTRVGAIMGTPVYMSPEQCAGNVLDARSDIYSLGVIAYQMLAGEPPFAGVTGNVMQEHIKVEAPPLRERNKKVPKLVAKVVMTALAKKPEDRPQTAAAFASSLRGQAEGIGALYRRAISLYSEYFPKFLRMSLIAHIPVIITTALLIGGQLAEKYLPQGRMGIKVLLICVLVVVMLLHIAAYFVASATISGMTAVIVTQLAVAPLRPVELRSAFAVLKKRWKPFLKTALSVTLRIIFGFILFVIPGIIMIMRYALYAPVVLMEGLEKKAARKRARELASRSWRTIIIVSLLQFLIPMVVSFFTGRIRLVTGGHQERSLSNQITQQVLSLVNIFVVPLMSIVPALLYLKMRQLGGETLADPLAEVEALHAQGRTWQQRMRKRLSLHPSRGSKVRNQTG